MYLLINGARHTVKRRIIRPNTVKYTFVTPAPADVSGVIQMFTDTGFLLCKDNVDRYEYKYYKDSLLTLTNIPEPEPVPETIEQDDTPTIEEQLRADVDYLSVTIGAELSAFETAQAYYPRLWSKERLGALVAAEKITKEQYTELTGESYE